MEEIASFDIRAIKGTSTNEFKIAKCKYEIKIPKPAKDSVFEGLVVQTPMNINLWQRMWMRFIGWQVTKL